MESVNYEGKIVNILTRTADSVVTRDLIANDDTSDVLNDAIFKRNSILETKYNIAIVGHEESTLASDDNSFITKAIRAGDAVYDFCNAAIWNAIGAIRDGYYIDILSLPYIDIGNKWWSESAMNDVTIKDHCYIALGDMSVQSYLANSAVFFNKSYVEKYNLDNLYTLVENGEWTYETMMKIAEIVTVDLNGDGMDENDQYGVVYNNAQWMPLYYACSEIFMSSDDGVYSLNCSKEKILTFLQNISLNGKDNTKTLYTETKDPAPYFTSGNVMFMVNSLNSTPALRSMDENFGLLPCPKERESQEEYYSICHYGSASAAITIPITNTDTEFCGRFLEDLAFYSSEYVRPAFVEKLLKGIVTRDTESEAIVDFLVKNIRIDFALPLTTSTESLDYSIRSLMDKGSVDFSSMFASKLSKFNTAIQDYIDSIPE